MLKKWVFFFLFVLSSFAIPAGTKRLTQGFKIAKMHLEFPFHPDWNVISKLSDEEAKRILAQPFSYLNKGAQCYAFLSSDEKYVLKLFRFDQRHLFRNKKSKRPFKQKIIGFLEGCKLATVIAPEETGVMYLHLNQTSGTLPILEARGPLKQSVRLPLDRYRFALQQRATPLADGLLNAQIEGQLFERIEEIISLLETRISKGIGNTDPNLWRNFGFLEGRAIEFDFGNYIPRTDLRDSVRARAELERYMRPLRSWIATHAPEHLADFNARVEQAQL